MTPLISAAMLLDSSGIVSALPGWLLVGLVVVGAAGMWWLLMGLRNVLKARRREKQRWRMAATQTLAEARIQRATSLAVSQLLAAAGSELTDPGTRERGRRG